MTLKDIEEKKGLCVVYFFSNDLQIELRIREKNKKNKILQQQNRLLRKRINSIHSLMQHLKQKKLLSAVVIESTVPHSTKVLFKQILQRKQRVYPVELKKFALTLTFYSPKGYQFVRKNFNNALPHPRTLQKWYYGTNNSEVSLEFGGIKSVY
ncbi:uncharacterized protein LOC112904079 [Agrilus planipennis]|uniref:Uncharacterized protein LOC112904079 n=1 Tax=Agrilus planipennis TaxID=224129 RepID=A0A7F5R286_AGRPL|nr:uncharacterized protein LOC112904079 [Agrilus planipennis]